MSGKFARTNQAGDLISDKARLFILVIPLMEGDLRSCAILGPEALVVRTFRTCVDHRLGRIEDTLGRAVVLFEEDHLSLWKILLELANVPHISTPKEVDGLVIITNHKEVALTCTQLADQRVLGPIGILILVDE